MVFSRKTLGLYFFVLSFTILIMENFDFLENSFIQYYDEFYALLCVPLLFLNIKNIRMNARTIIIIFGLIFFLFTGFVGNLMYDYQNMRYGIMDSFLNLKFFMSILTTYYALKGSNLNLKNNIIPIIIFLFWLSIVGYHFYEIVTGTYTNSRFGIPCMVSYFRHYTYCAVVCFLTYCFCYVTYPEKRILRILFPVAAILTLRSKAIAASVLIISFDFFANYLKKYKFIFGIVVLVAIVLIGYDSFDEYFLGDSTIRSTLLSNSFVVANRCFPFGSGFGTYGSYFSGVSYSTLYYELNMDTIYGLSLAHHAAISDSFWPMIIAQNGYVGLVCYIVVLICILKMSYKKKYNKLFVATWGYLFVASLAESAFVNSYSVTFAIFIGILIIKGDINDGEYSCSNFEFQELQCDNRVC